MEDILQQGGQITLTALGSLAALFLLTKLSGNKQVSQMNLFDYVMGITIGSIAAEMASELESPLRPLWAMVVYGLTAWGIALLTNRSIRVRRFITGKPLILMDSGVIYRKNLRRARMDLNEFLMYCRVSGYFDLNQIQTAILEHNGTVTFLPASMQPAGDTGGLVHAAPAGAAPDPGGARRPGAAGESAEGGKGRRVAGAEAAGEGISRPGGGAAGYGGRRRSAGGISHGDQEGSQRNAVKQQDIA